MNAEASATFTSRRKRLPVLVLTDPVQDDFPVMIARRGLRLHNRSREGAAKYERQHTILARGRQ